MIPHRFAGFPDAAAHWAANAARALSAKADAALDVDFPFVAERVNRYGFHANGGNGHAPIVTDAYLLGNVGADEYMQVSVWPR